MNQDGLENFFGCLKSLCTVVVTTQYRTAYGTTIINNMSTNSSKHSNCEPDYSISLLDNIHEFLCNYLSNSKETCSDVNIVSNDNIMDTIIFEPQLTEADLHINENEAISLTSSRICKNVLERSNCENCRKILQTLPQKDHDIIHKMEASDKSMFFPSELFIRICKKLLLGIYELIPYVCSQNNVRQKILKHLEDVEVENIGCHIHEILILNNIKTISIKYALMAYCKNVNELLCGKIKSLPDNFDEIQKQAFLFNQKRKGIGKHTVSSKI